MTKQFYLLRNKLTKEYYPESDSVMASYGFLTPDPLQAAKYTESEMNDMVKDGWVEADEFVKVEISVKFI